MPNSTKAIIAIVSAIILSLGIFILTKSRPVENPAVSVASNSVSTHVSSSSKSVLSSSSQLQSSSSQSESVKVVEVPKVQQPKAEMPKVEIIEQKPLPVVELPKANLANQGTCESWNFNTQNIVQNNGECFLLTYYPSPVGNIKFSDKDYKFLNGNINDIAIYYHNSVRDQFPTNKHFISSFATQKLNNTQYLVKFDLAFKSAQEGGREARFPKTYLFTKINENDGEFGEQIGSSFPDGVEYQQIESAINQPNTSFPSFQIPDPTMNRD